jgi:Ecdysteroid kinase-like family
MSEHQGSAGEVPDRAHLSAILRPDGGGRIVSVQAAAIGAGQMSRCLRLGLTWEPPGAGPGTVVAKVAAASPRRRRVADAVRAYELEVGFYRDLAPVLSVHVPRCHYAVHQARPPEYCLVLADMSSLTPGDDLAGCSVDDAARALEELARLHAESAAVALPELTWLAPSTGPEYAERVRRLVSACGPRFMARYGPRLDDDTLELIRQFLLAPAEHGAPGPVAVLHGDFRADNLLIGDAGVTVVDWQTVSIGPVLSDVSYFLGASLPGPARRAAEKDLLDHYRSHLSRHGLSLSWDECWDGYRRLCRAGLVRATTAGTLVAETEQDLRTFATIATRCARQIQDLAMEPAR